MKQLYYLTLSLATALSGIGKDAYQSREGHPADYLPSYIRQVSGFGERPEWSHDGKRILFVDKPMGEVYEVELATGLIHPKTRHFNHYGFTRAIYLANDDILLVGPNGPFDPTIRDERIRARHLCGMSILDKSGSKPPVPLNTLCAEGPAVSRTRMRLAWTHRDQQYPEIGKNHAKLLLAEIEYKDGKPRLVNQRVAFSSHQLPFHLGGASLETQNLVPPEDNKLTFSVYVIEGGTNTDTYIVDTETGEFRNLTRSAGYYDEPEGVFPDGKFTCVEHAPSRGKAWPLADIYKLKLDGSGEMQRLTHFSDFKGYKGTQGVVSPDGKKLCFQIGKSGDEAGVGYGFFVMDLEAAAEHLGEFENFAGDEHPLQVIANRFETAWNEGMPLPAISKLKPDVTLDKAYNVQRAWVRRTLDEKGIGGVKGGVVSPGGQKWLGVEEPVGAILRASGRFNAKDAPVISMEKFPGLKLETEIGFVIGKRVVGKLVSVADFKTHVRGIVPAIELISGDWEGGEGKPNAADFAAINVSAAAYIVGEPVAPDAIDPKAITLSLSKDGKKLHEAPGSDCWKGPWETGLWLANFAHRQGITLEPGQVIICGALGKIQKAEAGNYRYDAGDLGEIRFQVQ